MRLVQYYQLTVRSGSRGVLGGGPARGLESGIVGGAVVLVLKHNRPLCLKPGENYSRALSAVERTQQKRPALA